MRNQTTERGFTLIELLVVIGIIGILASLAVQNFAALRMRGFDARAQTDLKNVASAEEAYFADHFVYKNCNETDCMSVLPAIAGLSSGVLLTIVATPSGFTGSARHPLGSGAAYLWDTSLGGLQ